MSSEVNRRVSFGASQTQFVRPSRTGVSVLRSSLGTTSTDDLQCDWERSFGVSEGGNPPLLPSGEVS